MQHSIHIEPPVTRGCVAMWLCAMIAILVCSFTEGWIAGSAEAAREARAAQMNYAAAPVHWSVLAEGAE